MAVSASSSTLLTALATAYATAANSRTSIEVDIINGRIQQQTRQKIDALQGPADTVQIRADQATVSQLNDQLTTNNKLATIFSSNGNVFSDLTTQLAALQTAIGNGDSQSFDLALEFANNDVGNLVIAPPTAPYQADNLESFKTNGLGIKSSASYDLSTPAGQAAATADVQNAQSLVIQLSGIQTSNQILAYNIASTLTSQINSINQTITEMQNENSDYISAQTDKLNQQAQIQENLIKLALGNSTTLSTALQQMSTTAQVATSPYDILGTSSSSTSADGSNPAVLSLLI
ncbi:MAG TPA: hypothetical protein VJR47_14980 [Stellaceae bacterium]|nr:hypothetical protein [Stellaceae bacterium]